MLHKALGRKPRGSCFSSGIISSRLNAALVLPNKLLFNYTILSYFLKKEVEIIQLKVLCKNFAIMLSLTQWIFRSVLGCCFSPQMFVLFFSFFRYSFLTN